MKKEELKKLRETTKRLATHTATTFYFWRKQLKKAEKLAQEFSSLNPKKTPPTAGSVCGAIYNAELKEKEFKLNYEPWLEKAKQYEIETAKIEKKKREKAKCSPPPATRAEKSFDSIDYHR